MSQNPHDALAKAMLARPQNAVGLLKALLPPALLERLDLATAEQVQGSFVDDRLRWRHTDVLYRVKVREAGRDALLYTVIEHASTEDPLLAARLLVYVARVLDDWLREHEGAARVPAVIPVVLYHGPTAWTAPTDLHALLDLPPDALAAVRAYVPALRFLLDDLTTRSDGDLRAREGGVLGRLALLLLRDMRDAGLSLESLGVFLHQVADLLAALPDRTERMIVFSYILKVAEGDRAAVEALLAEAVPPSAREDVVTVADQLRREGELKGKREGELKGLETLRRLLLRQLRARFGELPADVEARVLAADEPVLEAWGERFATATTLADVFAAPAP